MGKSTNKTGKKPTAKSPEHSLRRRDALILLDPRPSAYVYSYMYAPLLSVSLPRLA